MAELQAIVEEALELEASDIDLQRWRDMYRVRLRILDALAPSTRTASVSCAVVEPLIGVRSIELAGVRWRVSSVPTLGGTHVRLHRPTERSLDEIGLAEPACLHAELDRPGLVALGGTIGSGRTTTLYAALTSLDVARRTVVTVEEVIERCLDGVIQVTAPVRPDDPHMFARVVCDQGPDVVGLDRLSDAFMSALAVSLARAGASVLATIDALDAAAVPAKMFSLGVEPFQVVASLRLVIAQRLVRASCTSCLESDPAGAARLAALGYPDIAAFAGVGCERCDHTGFTGRIALFDVLPMTESIRELLLQGASEAEIRTERLRSGSHDLTRHALAAVHDGRCRAEDAVPLLAP